MRKKTLKFLTALAAAILVSASFSVSADELKGDEQSFFQRYSSGVQELIIKGLEFVGVPYRRGGTNPDVGMDCSGFVQRVFSESIGISLPRTAREMSDVGEQISKTELKPGDLVFFNTMRRAFSHVGIYLGNNQFVHAPRPGGEIRVEDMRQAYWTQRYDGARRITEK
ncbi:C40 family peptidase [Oryzomicrobium sp.]|uniref:C40 family peptidase n=1 Tax=Oryzomicrobium sp. TaxID=1911578 RepID=UPI0025EA9FB4|nr:C40 family peptidase [Oryzomicrobium sp.]MCE1242574.1 C40 family peptidase [Oryzomicrobium sp.]